VTTRSDLTLSERVGAWADDVREQFSDLDFRDPAHWPPVPRSTFLVVVALLVFGLSWYVWLGDSYNELSSLNAKEAQLRESVSKKLAKTSRLSAFKAQRDQVRGYVEELELQLPDQSGMNEFLTEINRLGLLRNVQFEFLRPAPVVQNTYYVEMPIGFRLMGSFHNVAAFAADIAQIQRVVHLQDLAIASKPDGTLSVEGTLRGYRQLDNAGATRKNAGKGEGT
jgi:type IV pilus assembly protein PilO